jgi:hypothetical protein
VIWLLFLVLDNIECIPMGVAALSSPTDQMSTTCSSKETTYGAYGVKEHLLPKALTLQAPSSVSGRKLDK